MDNQFTKTTDYPEVKLLNKFNPKYAINLAGPEITPEFWKQLKKLLYELDHEDYSISLYAKKIKITKDYTVELIGSSEQDYFGQLYIQAEFFRYPESVTNQLKRSKNKHISLWGPKTKLKILFDSGALEWLILESVVYKSLTEEQNKTVQTLISTMNYLINYKQEFTQYKPSKYPKFNQHQPDPKQTMLEQ